MNRYEYMARQQQGKVKVAGSGPKGYILLITFIGVAIYFINLSSGLWGFIISIIKGAVWPALALYEILKVLNI